MAEPVSDGVPVADLLRHEGWLRGVLQRYVQHHDVDDVLQDTWLSLLRQPPRRARALGAMLRVVSTRRALAIQRAASRRLRRERGAARPLAVSDLGPARDRADLRRALAQLPESYRWTLQARYFAGLGVREIAERFGIPDATVRTRLRRGRRLLAALLPRER